MSPDEIAYVENSLYETSIATGGMMLLVFLTAVVAVFLVVQRRWGYQIATADMKRRSKAAMYRGMVEARLQDEAAEEITREYLKDRKP